MQIPNNFNRPFCEYTLQDWWLWQNKQDTVVIPEKWLKDQHCLDLWFHMFCLAHKTSPDYLTRLVQACVNSQQWTIRDLCTSLTYWNEHRNFLGDEDLLTDLLNCFETVYPTFSRAVALSGMQSVIVTAKHINVLQYALHLWNKQTPINADHLIKWQTFDFFKYKTHDQSSNVFTRHLSNFFKLEDFFNVIAPTQNYLEQQKQEYTEFQQFKHQHKPKLQPPYYSIFYDNLSLRPTYQVLQNMRYWPVEKMTKETLNAFDCLEEQLSAHQQWNDHEDLQWFLKDWRTDILLRRNILILHQNDTEKDIKKGKRKI